MGFLATILNECVEKIEEQRKSYIGLPSLEVCLSNCQSQTANWPKISKCYVAPFHTSGLLCNISTWTTPRVPHGSCRNEASKYTMESSTNRTWQNPKPAKVTRVPTTEHVYDDRKRISFSRNNEKIHFFAKKYTRIPTHKRRSTFWIDNSHDDSFMWTRRYNSVCVVVLREGYKLTCNPTSLAWYPLVTDQPTTELKFRMRAIT